mmetsp:Transcript_67666/g.191998  ORF Transcript_67666/g.191998 Transcript_67666/m.191998 type:complete len:209 (+) Transcript_67666:236-862(+)
MSVLPEEPKKRARATAFSFELGEPPAAKKDLNLASHVLFVVGCVQGHVGRDLRDGVQRVPGVLPVHKVALIALPGPVQHRHGRHAPRELRPHLHLRAREQLRLPAERLLHADALRNVLPAQHRGCGSDGLRPEREEGRVQRCQLDEVVREAEAVFGPPRPAQEPAQEGVHRGLVQAEPQRALQLAHHGPHLLNGARAVGHHVEPRLQF